MYKPLTSLVLIVQLNLIHAQTIEDVKNIKTFLNTFKLN